jgi:hypothetical protein
LWLQETPLLDGELVILEDGVNYLWNGWIGAYGRICLTNRRVVFCPARTIFSFPFPLRKKPFSIPLPEITHARPSNGIRAFLDWGRLDLQTHDQLYEFSFGLRGTSKRERWSKAILAAQQSTTD